MNHLGDYDVIVIGAGHAGIEAAHAAATLGARTAVFTMSLDAIGNMPCNPSIGGTAKGTLVRELDALGGVMGLAADATYLQSRMLNKGKGPAVHALRVQTDRKRYHEYMKHALELTPGLAIHQVEVVSIETENGRVKGVVTQLNGEYSAKCVVIATGTNLGGKIFVGDAWYASGPDGMHAANALTDSLKAAGLPLRRFKTGTPARVHRRSIDFSKLECQPGDPDNELQPFSFMTDAPMHNKVECWIAYTNPETHRIILDNIQRSPLYGGMIEGVGPRYCPSIEDKVVRFAGKDRHPIFVEPCGENTEEMYLQGASSSLPEDVQNAFYRSIKGFENIEIMRPAYAIEYDCVDPTSLEATLESKVVRGLYGAGQFNGTSGYEEAAAQGLLAGLNAARNALGEEQLILPRHTSYLGTLVDDLVTKGVMDPYRMMTSRSEYRLTLRQDNADQRLTPIGREYGLVQDDRWAKYQHTQSILEAERRRLHETHLRTADLRTAMEAAGLAPAAEGGIAEELLRRPEISYPLLAGVIGWGEEITPMLAERLETEIKYAGYIARQDRMIRDVARHEKTLIPDDFEYADLAGLTLEAREKLARIRPKNLGQAGRIPGVSPSDVAQLSIALAARGENKMEELKLYEGRPADCTGRLEKEIRTYDLLDKLGIPFWRTDHGWMKADTMEDCHVIDACLNATVCKNLFLCNRQKTNFYLLMMPGDKPFKTKELSHQLGIARLSFASPEDMEQYLDCTPGSSSIMGLANDAENKVQLLMDEDIKAGEYLGCHPCINTSSLKLRTADVLETFLPAVHHEPIFVQLTGE